MPFLCNPWNCLSLSCNYVIKGQNNILRSTKKRKKKLGKRYNFDHNTDFSHLDQIKTINLDAFAPSLIWSDKPPYMKLSQWAPRQGDAGSSMPRVEGPWPSSTTLGILSTDHRRWQCDLSYTNVAMLALHKTSCHTLSICALETDKNWSD